VDGTVKQILVNTIGGIIQPGMDLIEIVPANDTLLVEAKIRPSDIAFIHPGQKATVKLTAYDFSIYGGLDSVLELISADTITDERGEHFFQIQVRTNRNYLGSKENPLPIMPGMIASVDILTGKKTVMDYILKPLKRAQASALSER
jgi:adhesin transport system membrane fusion protein